jgi:hypothetical protein
VNISDLQHIESATETEVQGGRGWHRPKPPKPNPPTWGYYEVPCDSVSTSTYNAAGAEAAAQAFGSSTITSTTTDTLAVQGQFSGSFSSSFAEAI